MILNRRKTHAVDGTRAKLFEGGQMRLGSIPLVGGKAVLGPLGMKFEHERIAGHLGKNGSCHDRLRVAVSLDDGFARNLCLWKMLAIDKDVIGLKPEGRYGPCHRLQRSTKNVDLIDDEGIYDGDAVNNFFIFDDGLIKSLATGGSKFFAVIDPLEVEALGKDARCRNDRPGKRAASSFVNARYMAKSAGFGSFLKSGDLYKTIRWRSQRLQPL